MPEIDPPEGAGTALTEAQQYYVRAAELAQEQNYQDAVGFFELALHMDPEMHTARLQYGLLVLTMGDPVRSREIWQPLDNLANSSYLKLFKQGLEALIEDRFPESIRLIEQGIGANTQNLALNRDMAMLIERIRGSVDTATPQAEPAEKPPNFALYQQASDTEH